MNRKLSINFSVSDNILGVSLICMLLRVTDCLNQGNISWLVSNNAEFVAYCVFVFIQVIVI